jgi:hypothetical protein
MTADSVRLSPDGKELAYSNGTSLTLFFTTTGASKTVTTDVSERDFDWVSGTLYFSNHQRDLVYVPGEIWKLDATGEHPLYTSPLVADEFEWFVRPDGKIHAATHWGTDEPGWTDLVLVDPKTGAGEPYTTEPGVPGPHYQTFRSAESSDRRWLLSWHEDASTGNEGDVWLYDLTSAPHIAARKLVSGVALGYRTSSGEIGFNGSTSLAGLCRFVDGGFVDCKKKKTDRTSERFALGPSSVACNVTDDGVHCTNGDGSSSGTTAIHPEGVHGDTWFHGRFMFDERVGAVRRLSLLDPKTGGRENVVDRSCFEGSFVASATPQRLFVADCAGLHIAR